jgi:hypothetical protein
MIRHPQSRLAMLAEIERDRELLSAMGAPMEEETAFPTPSQRALAAALGVDADLIAGVVLSVEDVHAPATASRRDRRFLIAAFDAARAAYPDDVGDQRLVHERDAQPSRRHTTFN